MITALWLLAAQGVMGAFDTVWYHEWRGRWTTVLVVILGAEIVITLTDFVVETYDRHVEAGERVTHALMAILYGAMLAMLIPVLARWSMRPTGFARSTAAVPAALTTVLTLMAIGVFLSGVRDLIASMKK